MYYNKTILIWKLTNLVEFTRTGDFLAGLFQRTLKNNPVFNGTALSQWAGYAIGTTNHFVEPESTMRGEE